MMFEPYHFMPRKGGIRIPKSPPSRSSCILPLPIDRLQNTESEEPGSGRKFTGVSFIIYIIVGFRCLGQYHLPLWIMVLTLADRDLRKPRTICTQISGIKALWDASHQAIRMCNLLCNPRLHFISQFKIFLTVREALGGILKPQIHLSLIR